MDDIKDFGLPLEKRTAMTENFARIRAKIEEASARANNPDVTLVAATKYATAAEINFAHEYLGLGVIGENRVQALNEKYDELNKDIEIQLIGSLQTNKVKYIIGRVSLIQSLDSLKLAAEIDRLAKKAGIVQNVLLEFNSGDEENKGGIMEADLDGIISGLSEYENIALSGLMTMAPVCDSDDEYKRYFSHTREIFEKKIVGRTVGSPILSMGMSGSFVPAIECGATMVRVGSALFK